jgi:hypothetical protein
MDLLSYFKAPDNPKVADADSPVRNAISPIYAPSFSSANFDRGPPLIKEDHLVLFLIPIWI